jgi:hypothetical protein
VVRREVVAWRGHLAADPVVGGLGLAPATVNAHLASLSGFATRMVAHEPAALPHGNRAPRSPTCRSLPWNREAAGRKVLNNGPLCDPGTYTSLFP